MIRLRLNNDSRRRIGRRVARLRALAEDPEPLIDPVAGAIRIGFAENFGSESAGGAGWAPLARATVLDRIRHGYPGAHPILHRTGAYARSFILENHPAHISLATFDGRRLVITEGSQDYRAIWHENGTINMPARPVTRLSETSRRRIYDTIRRGVIALLTRQRGA